MQKKKIYLFFITIIISILLLGCGESKKRITDGSEVYVKRQSTKEVKDTEETENIEEIALFQEQKKIYVVTAIDTKRKTITLRNRDTSREKPYNYTGATYIKSKYGDNLTINQLIVGELVTIEQQGETLTNVQISDEIFSYDDLHNFTLDIENKILTVGGSKYYFDDSLLVYHDNSQISLSEVSEQDTICMKGKENQIYTIQVTSGHGTVVLENIDIFQGGYITIGNIVSTKVIPQMRIEVPEGRYLLAVANDGYGGSREITVEANRETSVNLNELKGEGPKTCQIQFKIVPESGKVYLDGELIDIRNVVEVRYGTHKLTAKADGYKDWSRILSVNSKTAELTIQLSDKESEDTISTSNTNNNNNNKNNNNSNNNTNNK